MSGDGRTKGQSHSITGGAVGGVGWYFSVCYFFFLSKYKISLTSESTEYFLLAPQGLGSGKEKFVNISHCKHLVYSWKNVGCLKHACGVAHKLGMGNYAASQWDERA